MLQYEVSSYHCSELAAVQLYHYRHCILQARVKHQWSDDIIVRTYTHISRTTLGMNLIQGSL